MSKILIIEDEFELREEVERILTFEHFIVFTAANAFEGLEILKTVKPDLILCDILMPGMSGFDFLRN